MRYYCLFFKHILFYEMVDGNGHKIYAFIAEKENIYSTYDENKRTITEKNDNIYNRHINFCQILSLRYQTSETWSLLRNPE